MTLRRIELPFKKEELESLRVGDKLLLNGKLLVARDAAHERLVETYKKTRTLPIDIKNATIFYMGPSPTPPGKVIGAAGPTTAHRMDTYAPLLYDLGVDATIGKGLRGEKVIDSIKKNHSLYLCAIGGAGALYQRCIKSNKILLYSDLGPEAIREIRVVDFPVTVAIDSCGNTLYSQTNREQALEEK